MRKQGSGKNCPIQDTSPRTHRFFFRNHPQQCLSSRSPITSTSEIRWGKIGRERGKENEALKERRIEMDDREPESKSLPSCLGANFEPRELTFTRPIWKVLWIIVARISNEPDSRIYEAEWSLIRKSRKQEHSWWKMCQNDEQKILKRQREQEFWTTFFPPIKCTLHFPLLLPVQNPKTILWLLFGVSGWFQTGRVHNESGPKRRKKRQHFHSFCCVHQNFFPALCQSGKKNK